MARICIDARTITATPSGVGRYARALVPEIVRAAPQHDFIILRHTSRRDPIVEDDAEIEEIFCEAPCDDLRHVARGARQLERLPRCDLYHSLFHMLPFDARRALDGAAVVVTLHDLVWIDHPLASQPDATSALGVYLFGLVAIPYALRTADRIIAPSRLTELRSRRFRSSTPTAVVPHGVEARFFDPPPPLPRALAGLEEAPFVLAVGNDKRYKNLETLARAFARATGDGERTELSGARLVMVGRCEGLRPLLEDLGVADRSVLPGFLEDAELRALLGRARAFVFPSRIEGFGLPVLEAMAAGAPAIVSDLEPMRSVAGGAAALVDPDDERAMADTIARALVDEAWRRGFIDRGRERARGCTWARAARETLAVYEAALGEGDGGRR
jgi:glycosyltransferase involved in cell wall biosynthesis